MKQTLLTLALLCLYLSVFGQTGSNLDPFTSLGQARGVTTAGIYHFELSGQSFSTYVDAEGYVHLLSQVDGEFAGRVKADGDGVRADMVAEDNRLYVYGNSGDLIAYKITAKD